MLKLFRNLRKRLLSESKFSNYILYAIGEIVLVVIGILIALSINTWNENTKNKASENAYLNDLVKDFVINLQLSNRNIDKIEKTIPKLIALLEQSAMEAPTIALDSLNAAFTLINDMPSYNSTDRVYNNLIGSGDFKLISNAELKKEIGNYYKAVDLVKLVQNTHELELVNSFQPYIMDHLDFQAVTLLRVNDFPIPPAVEENKILDVLKDRKFRNIITLKLTILTDLLHQNRNLEKINSRIVRLIKEQIQS
ncbi:DUF6090 family protein [Gaetbulibacter aestuarii]|uniref:DUF6090 family protein n=1 Tax=Gaetbulibacter aestuarii TaxID=1502358 RepID=A0ABW7MYW4_9FLAO